MGVLAPDEGRSVRAKPDGIARGGASLGVLAPVEEPDTSFSANVATSVMMLRVC